MNSYKYSAFTVKCEVDGIFEADAEGPDMRKYAGARLGYRPGGEECWRGEAIISLRRCVGEASGQIGQKPAPRIAEATRAVPKSSNLEPKVAVTGAPKKSVPVAVV